jgi:hypothetical protein
MKFGFYGAGEVAQTYAKHFVRHGLLASDESSSITGSHITSREVL